MSYFPAVRGVVIGYSNVEFIDGVTVQDDGCSIMKIEGGSPVMFGWVRVNFLCWSVVVGDVLEGDVYLQTAGHLGLLIADTFNCSIRKYGIPDDWEFVPVQEDEEVEEVGDGREEIGGKRKKSFGYWVDGDGVKVDGKLRFTVKAVHTGGRVVSVDGTLIKPGEEKSAQPVSRGGKVDVAVSGGKHKKFDDDEDDGNVTVTVIPEPEDDDNEQLPAYIKASDDENEDEQVVNKDSDSEDEVESD